MRLIKTVLLVAAGFLATLLVTAAFLKKDLAIERQITIERPKAEVFAYIKMLKNQNKFSKWANIDPAMKSTFHGKDGAVGAVSAWESEHESVGVGEQEIKSIVEGQKIEYELRFKKPMEATDQAYMITESAGPNATVVKWGFRSHMGFPGNLVLIFMNLEQMLSADLDTGLYNLKKILEKR
jgi:uncharacterized protein YndB with AHSA1/START domain